MKIRYLYNPNDSRVNEFTQYISGNFPQFLTETNPNMYLVGGGDGAMLHAIQEHIDDNIPFLGKAMGTLNFLMNSFTNNDEIINALVNESLRPEEITTSAIEAVLDDKIVGQAVNEVIVGDTLTNYYHINISTEDKTFNNFNIAGSGISISTAIGSTAFNFNNNGQILPLDSCLLSITGIVCNRYLNDIIPFQKIKIKADGAKLFLSNIESGKLDSNSELILRKGKTVKLLYIDKKEFLKKRIEFAHRYRR